MAHLSLKNWYILFTLLNFYLQSKSNESIVKNTRMNSNMSARLDFQTGVCPVGCTLQGELP